jgi:hypothetical protein
MATIYQLKGRDGHLLRVALAGPKLVTGEGERRVIQEFPDEVAAYEHLERTMRLHRRDGYTLVEARETDEEEVLAADPLVGHVEWEPRRRRLHLTFRDREGVDELCAAAVARVAAVEAKTLQILCDLASPGSAFPAALARQPLPALSALIFDTHFQTVCRQYDNTIGDLADILKATPNLERLFATGAIELSALTHPRLRELYLLGDPLPERALAGLGASTLPALGRLALTLATESAPIDPSAAVRAVRSLSAPGLQHIVLEGAQDVVGALRALLAEPRPGSWTRLSINGSILDEDGLLAALSELRPALSGLRALALPLADDLSSEGDAAARRLVPVLRDIDDEEELLTPTAYEGW